MDKLKQTLISITLWIFVGFCLIMAIGMPFGAGTFLMILTAIMAAPLAPIRKIWETVLNKLPQEKKGLLTNKKRQENKRKTTAKNMKFLIVVMVFLFGFIFGMIPMI